MSYLADVREIEFTESRTILYGNLEIRSKFFHSLWMIFPIMPFSLDFQLLHNKIPVFF